MASLPPAAACKGPIIKPDVEVPPAYRFQLPAEMAPAPAWWNAYPDPYLNALVQEALTNNRDLRIATARVDEFAAILAGTRSQGLAADRLWPERQPIARQRTEDSRFRRSAEHDFQHASVGELGDRPVGPHPPRDRGRARQSAGDRGSAPRRDPDSHFVGDRELRHAARPRRAIARRAGDGGRPQEVRRPVRDEAGRRLDLRVRNVAGARRI